MQEETDGYGIFDLTLRNQNAQDISRDEGKVQSAQLLTVVKVSHAISEAVKYHVLLNFDSNPKFWVLIKKIINFGSIMRN